MNIESIDSCSVAIFAKQAMACEGEFRDRRLTLGFAFAGARGQNTDLVSNTSAELVTISK